jgi:hypothetical protein
VEREQTGFALFAPAIGMMLDRKICRADRSNLGSHHGVFAALYFRLDVEVRLI